MWEFLNQLRAYSVIIVDDSTDSTRKIIKLFPNVTLLPGAGRGIAHAYSIGLTFALQFNEPILQMDAGLSHRPEDIDLFLNKDTGLVLAQRRVPIWGFRGFITRMASFLAGLPFDDVTCGFRLWHPGILRDILPHMKSKGNAFQIELLAMAWNNGVHVEEVEIPYILTNSHLKPWMLIEAVKLIWRKR